MQSTLELIGKSLAQAILEGEISPTDPQAQIRHVAELGGAFLLPEQASFEMENLDPFSIFVGHCLGIAGVELLKANGGDLSS